jgi:hypothetical protein
MAVTPMPSPCPPLLAPPAARPVPHKAGARGAAAATQLPPPLPGGTTRVGTHATLLHGYDIAGVAVAFGWRQLQAYQQHCRAARDERLGLRASAQTFVPAAAMESVLEKAAKATALSAGLPPPLLWPPLRPIAPGLPWRLATCPLCAGSPSYDAWHALAECRYFQDERKAAYETAAVRAESRPAHSHLAPVFRALGTDALMYTAVGQLTSFLGGAGFVLPAEGGLPHGLPDAVARCFEAAPLAASQASAARSAAAAITLPSFAALMRAVTSGKPA